MMKNIDIALITDKNYFFLTKVCMRSIISTKDISTRVRFHIICVDLEETMVNEIKNMEQDSVKINTVIKGNTFEGIAQKNFRVSSAALMKFSLPELISDTDKLLYLDGDIIVTSDISEMFDINLDGKYAAVCPDVRAEELYKFVYLGNDRYFNSGMILFNAELCRKDNITEQLINWKMCDKKQRYMDQDAFNAVLGNNSIYLDNTYNFMNSIPVCEKDLLYIPKIIHFTPDKPDRNVFCRNWKYFYDNIEYEDLMHCIRNMLKEVEKKYKNSPDINVKEVQKIIDRIGKLEEQNNKIISCVQGKTSLKKLFYNKTDTRREFHLFGIPLYRRIKTEEGGTKREFLCNLFSTKTRLEEGFKVKQFSFCNKPLFAHRKKLSSQELPCSLPSPSDGVFRIAIEEGGGLGDCLIQLIYLKEIRKMFATPVRIDFYTKMPKLFKGIPFIDNSFLRSEDRSRLAKEYDAYIQVIRVYKIITFNEVKARSFSPAFADFINSNKCFIEDVLHKNTDICKLNHLSMIRNKTRIDQSDMLECIPISGKCGKYFKIDEESIAVIEKYGLTINNYITINRGVDGVYTDTHPKMWPLEYYNELIRRLKEELLGIKIVQLGASEEMGLMEGVDICMVGKTTLHECAVLLKYSLLHIDSEGGLVHLKNCLHGRSAVFFGPTAPQLFGYSENLNLHANACPINCDWITSDWSKKCLAGYGRALCMTELRPENCFDKIREFLSALPQYVFHTEKSDESSMFEFLENCTRVAQISAKKTEYYDKVRSLPLQLTIFDQDALCPESIKLTASNVVVEYSDRYNITSCDDMFDAVYCDKDVLSGIKYVDFAIKEMLRILKPGGRLYIRKNLPCNYVDSVLFDVDDLVSIEKKKM